MKKVILFSGSNSSNSINEQLIQHTGKLLRNVEIEILDLKHLEIPMYSMDIEKSSGAPAGINTLFQKLQSADAVIISTPEHNSMPPAFFKNILDWMSRLKKLMNLEVDYLNGKSVLLMSASPGKGGAQSARALVKKLLGYAEANSISEFTFPQFAENFQDGKMANEVLETELKILISELL